MDRIFGTRLDAMIARLSAQQAHLDDAINHAAHVPGPVLEIGLGKGRTYDHLCARLPHKIVMAFDGSLHAPGEVHPSRERLVLGDFRETLPAAIGKIAPAAIIHADIGSDDRKADFQLVETIAPYLAALLHMDGILLSDRTMPTPALVAVDAPTTCWPYFRYKLR